MKHITTELRTSPPAETNQLFIDALLPVDDLQDIQDKFANATGVASIITRPDGAPITKPSNFSKFCSIIRESKIGLERCYKSDSLIGVSCDAGPTIKHCLSAGLWDAGAGISVGGKHIANWLIGQVRDESQTEEQICSYARDIGLDEALVVAAFRQVPVMKREKFEDIASFLHTTADHISRLAYKNLLLSQRVAEQDLAEEKLRARNRELRRASRATVIALANLAEFRDEDTGDHVVRVALLAHEIARKLACNGFLDITDDLCRTIGVASILHDIGKVVVPDNILLKPAQLDASERLIIQQHTIAGSRILGKSKALAFDASYLELAAEIALNHHERYDGAGYPHGLIGENIPLSARIVAVADVFDALTSERPYKSPWPPEEAASFLKNNAGIQFDPYIVDTVLSVLNERQNTHRVIWTDDMSVGNALLDRDHRVIINIVNQMALPANCIDRIAQEFVLDELIGQLFFHFSREEELMRQSSYSDIEYHINVHREIEVELNNYRVLLESGDFEGGHSFWSRISHNIVDHITTIDKKIIRQ
ncbi:MAG: PocR ligand-binding domain-containing protein [Rhodospirillaceae bacterium]